MKKLIIGNWKMNPTTLDEAKRIYKSTRSVSVKLKSTNIVVCPPFVYLPILLKSHTDAPIAIGAQNVSSEETGAHTGEVSPLMLRDMGVKYVIVGHSENRATGETDEKISIKVSRVLESGMYVVLCVGEKERYDNGSHLDILKDQIKGSLNNVSKKNFNKLIVAYEPVWAIGAKEAMEPSLVLEMSLFIKKVLADMYGHDEAVSTSILYGGSVNFRNAGDIIKKGEVDGLLVGRESVNTLGFKELLLTVDTV